MRTDDNFWMSNWFETEVCVCQDDPDPDILVKAQEIFDDRWVYEEEGVGNYNEDGKRETNCAFLTAIALHVNNYRQPWCCFSD
ncbi:hypothetical protein ACFL2Q_11295 [Thermodesulfobacteriota bacterium]